MSSKNTHPKLTPEVLRAYSAAALRNATDLHAEAVLLLDHGHRARAYFLAVAAIEETGKALEAFDAQNRNLANPAVVAKLKHNLEDHSQKITYALGGLVMKHPNQREGIKLAVDLMVDLKRGREPSMYSDLRIDPDGVQLPQDVVQDDAARDCTRLAADCLAHAQRYIKTGQPRSVTHSDDKMFALNRKQVQKIFQTEDFWWCYLSRREAGDHDAAQAVVDYAENYARKNVLFKGD